MANQTETKTQPRIEIEIRPTRMEVAKTEGPFDQAYEALIEQGYEIISLPQNGQLRIQQGADSGVSRKYNWVKDGFLYVPGEKPRLVRNSPIVESLETVREATQAHRNGREYFLTDEQTEKAREDSIELPTKNTSIPTNRFADDALTAYAFGGEEQARQYGEFLKNTGINEMPIWVVSQDYVNSQEQPFVRQMWFNGVDGRSGLDGYYGGLHGAGRMRGVKIGAEGTASEKQSIESYTPKQISETLNRMNLSGLEEGLIEGLKQ